MDKPILLDLYCGGGGATKGYQRAGFYVIGVDINPQPNYCGDEFYQADALEFMGNEDLGYNKIVAIHASPPCQAYTKKFANWGRKRRYYMAHPDLIVATREVLQASGLPYVMENVNGSPLDATLMLCGTMFGLPIIKHRYFEFNWPMNFFCPQVCDHRKVYNPWSGSGRSAKKMREAMGIDWLPISGGASRKAGYTGDLFNAIPPAYTEYIGKYLLFYLRAYRKLAEVMK